MYEPWALKEKLHNIGYQLHKGIYLDVALCQEKRLDGAFLFCFSGLYKREIYSKSPLNKPKIFDCGLLVKVLESGECR
jgi:hypothetical protein